MPGSRVLYEGEASEGTGDRISDRLDEAANMLTTWARVLTEARSFVRPLSCADAVLSGELSDEWAEALADDAALMVTWLCYGFDRHLTTVATLDWCGDFVRDLAHHEAALRELTETAVPGWYAGVCRRDKCEARTYVVPGLTWVKCPGCGATTYARDHLDVVIREASEWVATPKRLAEALVALVDSELSVERLRDRISKWGKRGHLEAVRGLDADGDSVGPIRYRLGDVFARVASEGPTRREEPPVLVIDTGA